MLLAVPFIEIGGQQKITIASICDKKETFSLIKRYKRSPKIAGCEVTHNFSFSRGANLLHPGSVRVYEEKRDQPMPGPFPAPPIFWGKSPGDEVALYPSEISTL